VPTYYLQANPSTGWTLHRGAGLTQFVQSLSAIRMLMKDAGPVKLIVLDRNGNELS